MRTTFRTFVAAAIAAAVLGGCATAQREVHREGVLSTVEIQRQQRELMEAAKQSEQRRLAAQEVSHPYVAGNTRPLAREVTMPTQLRDSVKVTALFQRAPVDLTTATRQLSEATGLLITATPDALMPASAFAPKTSVVAAAPAAPPGTASAMASSPQVVVAVAGAPIWQVLDDVARQIGAAWRPTSSGAEFFRVETRVFDLQGVASIANTSVNLGRNAQQNALFTSESKSGFRTTDQNVLAGIRGTVDAMLTTGGKAVYSDEHQNVVITDTPASVERIAEFIARRNKAMTRRVRVVLEAVEVTAKDDSDASIDWNLVYNAVKASGTTTGPATMGTANSGLISLTQKTGPFAGSSLLVQALSEVGTVVSRRTFPFITTSGKPVTQAIRSTFNYVDQVQAATTATTVSAPIAPTVTQKDETVGTFVTLIPTAKEDGTIFLSIAFDVTTLDSLVPFTVGQGAAAVTVQQKTIGGQGVVEEVPVRSGQTVVIGGLELVTGQDTQRRLAKGVPMLFGGADKTTLQRTQMVLMVTAVTEEGV